MRYRSASMVRDENCSKVVADFQKVPDNVSAWMEGVCVNLERHMCNGLLVPPWPNPPASEHILVWEVVRGLSSLRRLGAHRSGCSTLRACATLYETLADRQRRNKMERP